MYTLGFRRTFVAHHYLVGGDWGRENFPNSHLYTLELALHGETLDQHGYLVDLVDVEAALDQVLHRYRERMLNDLPEFQGLNPSLEHFVRILAHQLAQAFAGLPLTGLTVRLWENQDAWAEYAMTLGKGEAGS